MIHAPGITVNGMQITPEQISAEVQYHPAPSLPEAKYQAMQALVIRELLIQQAVKRGLCDMESVQPDEVIDRLLAQELSVPEPNREECERYYSNNRKRFSTAPLFEVSHILYLAPPEDKGAREQAKSKAQSAINRIQEKPDVFETIARAESACSSGRDGGRLGQIGKGQTVPAFEAVLLTMQEGDISGEPVATEVGYHVIRVHKRAEGKLIPFETVAGWIADSLKQESWRRAFSQYVQILVGSAEISGFRLNGADTPLVQ
jgi:peptidyl-prolyl cis-trans isomerase C